MPVGLAGELLCSVIELEAGLLRLPRAMAFVAPGHRAVGTICRTRLREKRWRRCATDGAVAEGFEPSEAFTSRAFEARSLGRSDTPPPRRLSNRSAVRRIRLLAIECDFSPSTVVDRTRSRMPVRTVAAVIHGAGPAASRQHLGDAGQPHMAVQPRRTTRSARSSISPSPSDCRDSCLGIAPCPHALRGHPARPAPRTRRSRHQSGSAVQSAAAAERLAVDHADARRCADS
jgi:hypothetical protein